LSVLSRFKKPCVKNLIDDEQGNFATIAAVAMSTLLLFTGFTVDNMRLTQAASELQSITDAGVVAATSNPEFTQEERQAVFQNVVDTRSFQNDNLNNIQFTLSSEGTNGTATVKATTSADVALLFNGFFGDSSRVSKSAEATTDNRTIELAIVLDISSSMTNSRLKEMKEAASTFVEDMFDNDSADRVHISMVPYGGAVRLPQQLNFLLDPPTVQERAFWKGGVWNGCFFMLPDEYENGINRQASRNPWCPRQGNEVVGLTQDKQKLLNTISNFSRSDGTVTGIAAAWGLTTLNPDWRGVYPNTEAKIPFNYGGNRRKIMILMSDGGSSDLVYPLASDFDLALPFEAINNTSRRARSRGEQNTAQQRTCDHVQSVGVEMYTVGFQITDNTHINNLRNCASNDSQFFLAGAGDLGAAFEQIGGQVMGVRISQ